MSNVGWDHQKLILLRQLLKDSFSIGDLEVLCFDLNINYDDIPGETITEKSQHLIIYMQKRGRLQELIDLLAIQRSNVDWPEVNSKKVPSYSEHPQPAFLNLEHQYTPSSQTSSNTFDSEPAVDQQPSFTARLRKVVLAIVGIVVVFVLGDITLQIYSQVIEEREEALQATQAAATAVVIDALTAGNWDSIQGQSIQGQSMPGKIQYGYIHDLSDRFFAMEVDRTVDMSIENQEIYYQLRADLAAAIAPDPLNWISGSSYLASNFRHHSGAFFHIPKPDTLDEIKERPVIVVLDREHPEHARLIERYWLLKGNRAAYPDGNPYIRNFNLPNEDQSFRSALGVPDYDPYRVD